jgi:hypothetical protein
MYKEQTSTHLITGYYTVSLFIAVTYFNANSSSSESSCSLPAKLHKSVHAVLVMFSDGCSRTTGTQPIIHTGQRNLLVLDHHATRHNTPIHSILSKASQLSFSQKALETLPEDGNLRPKHVGATIHN